MSYWIVFFSRNGLPFFLFDLPHIFLLSASWFLFFKDKAVHCILWVYVKKISYIYKNFFRARSDFVLSLETLGLVQTKRNLSSHSVSFSSASVLNLSIKDKANYFDCKINKKILKLTNLMIQISS